MKRYVVVDTNVFVSALLSKNEDAATVQVLNKLADENIVFLYSDAIETEYRDVLNRPKFHFDKPSVEYLLKTIKKYGILMNPMPSKATLPDPKDLPFYELVLANRHEETYLVTGNLKHFPKEPNIVTPRELLNILDK